jgi:hypothetical protein
MIKQTMVAVALLAALTISPQAQADASAESDDRSLFAKGENSLTLGVQSSYIDSDLSSDFGLCVGLERGLTDNLALGAGVTVNDTEDSVIDEAMAQGKFALPLRLPIKPYAFGHVGYAWDNIDGWFVGVGFGAEWSFKRGAGIYGDVGYREYESGPADGYMVRCGIRLGL